MTPSLPSPLPLHDRYLLQLALRIVPADDRPDWLRCWQAELWHRHHPRGGAAAHAARELYPGLLRDAFWLRKDRWRRTFAGTAVLLLATLCALPLLAVLPLLACVGDLHITARMLLAELPRFIVEAFFTSIVAFAIASRATALPRPRTHGLRLRAWIFEGSKLILLQTLAYLLSLDLTQSLHPDHRFAAEVLQPQVFAFFAMLTLHWSFEDQGTRCCYCLRSLSAPLRVGRPSWNFLDSNSTHLACPDGHGLLSVPEMETSWRRSSEWIAP